VSDSSQPAHIHSRSYQRNVVVDDQGRALLVDFGLVSAVRSMPISYSHPEISRDAIRSVTVPRPPRDLLTIRRWLAPESLDPDDDGAALGEETDIYSFSMLAMEVFTGTGTSHSPWLWSWSTLNS
jgi:serine/threonine protein kinase